VQNMDNAIRNNGSRSAVVLVAAVVVMSAIAGCAETRTEREFGDSVRKVMWYQTHEPNAGLAAGNEPPMGGDGSRLEGVLEVYRSDAAGTEAVSKPVSVQVGSGTR